MEFMQFLADSNLALLIGGAIGIAISIKWII